jgi:hypothetical protein
LRDAHEASRGDWLALLEPRPEAEVVCDLARLSLYQGEPDDELMATSAAGKANWMVEAGLAPAIGTPRRTWPPGSLLQSRQTQAHRRGCTVRVISGCWVHFIAVPCGRLLVLPARLMASL